MTHTRTRARESGTAGARPPVAAAPVTAARPAAGVGGYPTIESFRFGQEVTFSHNGKPFLIYTSRSWLLDDEGVPGRPLGMETGFWRPQPEGRVEVLLAHPTGITEIYLGEVTGTKIEMATD